MPGRTQYPTGEDLEAFLVAAGFSVTEDLADVDLELFAAAGWQAFNRESGRTMLAVSGTRSFYRPEGPRGELDLGEDLASGVVPSLTDDGTALTVNEDYVFLPLDAPGRGLPYNRLRFWRVWPTSRWTIEPLIVVTGSWGYGTTIPEDAWIGMLAMGALALAPQLAQLRTGGMQSWREADMAESYGDKPLGGLVAGWQMVAATTAGGIGPDGKARVGRYTRVTVG